MFSGIHAVERVSFRKTKVLCIRDFPAIGNDTYRMREYRVHKLNGVQKEKLHIDCWISARFFAFCATAKLLLRAVSKMEMKLQLLGYKFSVSERTKW